MAIAAAPSQMPLDLQRPQQGPAQRSREYFDLPGDPRVFRHVVFEPAARGGGQPAVEWRVLYRKGQPAGLVCLTHNREAASLALRHRVINPAVVARQVLTPAGRVIEDHLLYLNRPCPKCGRRDCAHIRGAAYSAQVVAKCRRDRSVSSSVHLAELDREETEPRTAPQTITSGKTRAEVEAGLQSLRPVTENAAVSMSSTANGIVEKRLSHTTRCLGKIVDHEPDDDEERAKPPDSGSEYDGLGLLADWGYTVRGAHPNAAHVRLIGAAIPVGMGAIDKVPHESVNGAGETVELSESPVTPLPSSAWDIPGSGRSMLEVLGPIVDREISREIAFVPRLAGDRDDLFQEAITALLADKGLSPDDARFERRAALVVRHRLIDLVRRQDAANRNLPQAELREERTADDFGEELSDDEEQMFCLLFAPRPTEDTALTRYVLDHATGFARKVVEAVLGEGTEVLGDLRDDPEYPGAIRHLTQLWGEGLTAVKRGEFPFAAAAD